jgi:hypothetical protein
LVELAAVDSGLLGASPDGSYWFTPHGGAGMASAIRSALLACGFRERSDPGNDPDFVASITGEFHGAQKYRETALAMLADAPSAAAVGLLLAAMTAEIPRPSVVRPSAMLAAWPSTAPWLTKPLVVLVGPANAGKSTLFNRLVDQGSAIVSTEPGTTRDVLTGDWTLPNGAVVTLADTPGLRPDSEITSPGEREGAAIAKNWIEMAACRIVLAPGNAENEPELLGVHVASMCDIFPPPGWADLAISAKTGDGLGVLTESVMGLLFRRPSDPIIPLSHAMVMEIQTVEGLQAWFG